MRERAQKTHTRTKVFQLFPDAITSVFQVRPKIGTSIHAIGTKVKLVLSN